MHDKDQNKNSKSLAAYLKSNRKELIMQHGELTHRQLCPWETGRDQLHALQGFCQQKLHGHLSLESRQ